MKKLLVLMLVLGIAGIAQAGFLISVDGVVDPEDSTIVLQPSQEVIIDIHGVDNPVGAVGGWLLIQGPGSIDASSPTNLWANSAAGNMADPPLADYIAALAGYGYPGVVDIIEWEVKDTDEPFDAPNGLLIDGLVFHCEGPEDVILTLCDLELTVFDTQVIHQPEPATVMLLTLGGLLLRRRR